MKMKILYVCFTLSFLINMALSIHLLKRQPVCEHKHWDDIDRTKDVIPDGKTAILLAKEQLDGKWIGEDYPYVYFVFFNEPSYEWIVFFRHRPEDRFYVDGECVVWLRRDNGILNKFCR